MADGGGAGVNRELVIRRKGRRLSFGLESPPQATIDTLPWGDLPGFGDGVLFQQTLQGESMSVSPGYLGFAQRLYKEAPSVFALIANRQMLFQEAQLAFARVTNGKRGDLFTSAELKPLQEPWPGGTTRDLLGLAEMFNSLAGNAFFALRKNGQLRMMRPDWTGIILGSDKDPNIKWYDLDAEVIGYTYQPGGGKWDGNLDNLLLPEEVIHYKPIADPEVPHRGMSWLTPIVQEALADKEMTSHKRKFLQGGATPNLAVTLDPVQLGIKSPEDFKEWVRTITAERESRGGNPYQWFFSVAGADPKVIGANLDNMDFSQVQAAGEVRMAAAGMVHPAVAGFSEGLKGSALNSGNLKEAFRQFASGTMRPLWGSFAGAAGRVIIPPASGGPAVLWFDDSQIAALKEDIKDLADVQQKQAATMSTLYMAGWDPDSIVDSVISGDLRMLKGKHSGAPSVQVQPSGSTNGKGDPAAVPVP